MLIVSFFCDHIANIRFYFIYQRVFSLFQDNYWKVEAEFSIDWIVTENDILENRLRSKFEELIEKWLAVRLYHMAGLKRVKQIPHPSLVTYFTELRSSKNARQRKKSSKRIRKDDDDDDDSDEFEIVYEDLNSSFSVREAEALLLQEFTPCFKRKKSSKISMDVFVNVLVSSDNGIIPSKHIMNSIGIKGKFCII